MTDRNDQADTPQEDEAKFEFGGMFTEPKPPADNQHVLASDGVFCFRDECGCHESGDRQNELITTEESFTVRGLQSKLLEHQARWLIA